VVDTSGSHRPPMSPGAYLSGVPDDLERLFKSLPTIMEREHDRRPLGERLGLLGTGGRSNNAIGPLTVVWPAKGQQAGVCRRGLPSAPGVAGEERGGW
jgi:hypothetical protein